MTTIRKLKHVYGIGLVILLLLLSGFMSGTSFSHGPKKHSEGFTSLQAVKKGLNMFDRLIGQGKLGESWETDLDSIEVATRASGKQKEFVVKFNRAKGEPKSCFIFFSEKGEYKGSNFTGE
jgi:hypothetical protein